MSECGKLAAALALAGAKIKNVPKTGKNPHFGYMYATESDIVGAVRAAMFECGVALVPAVTSFEREPVEIVTKNGTRSTFRFTVNMAFTLVHAESGEQIVTPWTSESMDSEDKGLSKCFTNALKYFLRQLFLIDTGDLADEIDAGHDDGAARKTGPATVRTTNGHGGKGAAVAAANGLMNEGQKTAIERLMMERRNVAPVDIVQTVPDWPHISMAKAGLLISELQK